MDGFLTTTVIILAFIVFLGYFNERVTKLTYEISLMLFSVIRGGIFLIAGMIFSDSESIQQLLERLQIFNLESFLMDGVLCFMLFAGSCHMRLLDFKKHARIISLLSIVATFLGAVFYGPLFFHCRKTSRSSTYTTCLPDVWQYRCSNRSDCCNKYPEKI